jgi:hypothetical protein
MNCNKIGDFWLRRTEAELMLGVGAQAGVHFLNGQLLLTDNSRRTQTKCWAYLKLLLGQIKYN